MKKLVKILFMSILCLSFASCVVINVDGNYQYDDSDDYEIGNAKISGEVKSIDIDWVSGFVGFDIADGNEVYFEETDSESYSEKKRVHYKYDESSKTLKIKFCASTKKFDFGDLEKEIMIYIPKQYTSLEVKVNAVSADIGSIVPCINNLKINTVSGNSKIREIEKLTKLDFIAVSGNLEVSADVIKDGRFDTTSGNVSLVLDDGNNLDFDNVSGNVYIEIPECLGFHVDYHAIKDRFSTNVNVKLDDGECYYGNEKLDVKCDSVSGELEIKVIREAK